MYLPGGKHLPTERNGKRKITIKREWIERKIVRERKKEWIEGEFELRKI